MNSSTSATVHLHGGLSTKSRNRVTVAVRFRIVCSRSPRDSCWFRQPSIIALKTCASGFASATFDADVISRSAAGEASKSCIRCNKVWDSASLCQPRSPHPRDHAVMVGTLRHRRSRIGIDCKHGQLHSLQHARVHGAPGHVPVELVVAGQGSQPEALCVRAQLEPGSSEIQPECFRFPAGCDDHAVVVRQHHCRDRGEMTLDVTSAGGLRVPSGVFAVTLSRDCYPTMGGLAPSATPPCAIPRSGK